jgi:hypothetical protein
VQQHDDSMFVTQLGQGGIERLKLLQLLLIGDRVVAARQAGKAVAAHLAFFDRLQPSPREASALVDEEVVHDAGQPGARLIDFNQVVQFSIGLNKEFLKQVFRFGLLAGETPREPVQPLKVRAYEFLEGLSGVVYGCCPFFVKT